MTNTDTIKKLIESLTEIESTPRRTADCCESGMGTAKVGDKICFAQLSRPFQRINDAKRFLNHMAHPPKDVCIWGSSSRGL